MSTIYYTDCNASNDVILPVLDKKYKSDALFILECKQTSCCLLDTSLLYHKMMLFSNLRTVSWGGY